MTKLVVVVVVLAILIVSGAYYIKSSNRSFNLATTPATKITPGSTVKNSSPSATLKPSEVTVVNLGQNGFDPKTVELTAGQYISLKSTQGETHEVILVNSEATGSAKDLAGSYKGGGKTVQFSSAGTFQYSDKTSGSTLTVTVN